MRDRGFTLIELVMVMVIVMVVAFVVGDSVVMGVNAYFAAGNRGEAIDKGRLALERMQREIRNSIEFSNATASTTALCFDDIYGDTISFRYTGTRVVREEVAGGLASCPGAAGVTLADGITAFSFSYIQNSGAVEAAPSALTKRVGISLTSSAGSESIELRTQAYPVNVW